MRSLRIGLWTGLMSLLALPSLQADDWPQWLGPKRDGVWRESGIVDKFPQDGLKENWRKPIGAGYAGPAVADDRVLVMDRQLARGARNPENSFAKPTVRGNERVLCFDEKTGEELWRVEYPCPYRISYASGPRCTPTVDGERVYTLGAMGNLLCLNVQDGKILWQHDFIKEFNAELPLWGFAAHPLVDGELVICLVSGTPDRAVIAFDKRTGDIRWNALQVTGDIGYCPPMIYQVGGTRQLIIWTNESVNGLDPETGKLYWSFDFPVRASLTAPTPRFQDGLLFVSSFYNGSRMLKLNPTQPKDVELLWRGRSNSERPDRTDGLHAIISTPFLENDFIYGVGSYGELRCLEAKTGKRLWSTLEATTDGKPIRWANAFIIKQQDRFFLFNDQGDLIIAQLSRSGYTEVDRVNLLPPTNKMANRPVLWMHPAFANQNVIARNDKVIVSYRLAK